MKTVGSKRRRGFVEIAQMLITAGSKIYAPYTNYTEPLRILLNNVRDYYTDMSSWTLTVKLCRVEQIKFLLIAEITELLLIQRGDTMRYSEDFGDH